MKSQYLKLLCIELFLLAFSFFHFVFITHFNIHLYIIELFFIFLALKYLFKLDKTKYLHKKEEIMMIFIFCLGYYVITYTLGFFIGFVYTTYSREITGIIENVFYSAVFIVILEHIREIVIQKTKYYKSLIILSCIVLTILELLFSISLIQFIDRKVTLEIILMFIIPCLFRNIFLTYSTFYFGKEGSIIYHLLMVTTNYFVPVFPAINDYINIILQIIHPLILIVVTIDFLLIKKYKKDSFFEQTRRERRNKILFACVVVFLAVMVYLVSNLGRFTVMAVGSGSMTGTVDKGDIVLIDKNDRNFEKGDIIAFNYNGSIIIHRIVNKVYDRKVYYETKGDSNNGMDNWQIYDENIMGKCIFTFKYIGIPTVMLSDFLRG